MVIFYVFGSENYICPNRREVLSPEQNDVKIGEISARRNTCNRRSVTVNAVTAICFVSFLIVAVFKRKRSFRKPGQSVGKNDIQKTAY